MNNYTPTLGLLIEAYSYYIKTNPELAKEEVGRLLAEKQAQAWTEGFIAQLWSEQSRNPYRKGENK